MFGYFPFCHLKFCWKLGIGNLKLFPEFPLVTGKVVTI